MATLWAGSIKPQAHMFFKKKQQTQQDRWFSSSPIHMFTACSLVLLPAGAEGLRVKKNVWKKNFTWKNPIT